MKQGDKIPVTIAGQVVAQATVKELGDGTATLLVPGTLVVMAVRTEIAPEVETPVEQSTSETIITGVDRVDADGTVIDSTEAGTPEVKLPEVTNPSSNEPASQAAPVVETQPVEQTHPVVSDNNSAGVDDGSQH